MPSFAERALEGMPKRPTVEHVAGAVEADLAARSIKRERLRAEAERKELKAARRRREEAERAAAAQRVAADRIIRAVRGATKGNR